jgi:hypothetical protein
MRTFLRHTPTGHYYQATEKWGIDRDEAHDFARVSRAIKKAHKLRMRELEVEMVFEDLEEAPATPFQTFLRGLARARRHSIA